ncbi:MAG: NAD(P)-dependent oxidoreductase, partial [Candidatus Omnitrophota bacterium]
MVKSAKSDIIFFEAFDEEQKLLRKLCPSHIRAEYTSQTIQESKMKDVPAALVSIRTQSKIPFGWAPALKGILTRSTGFDHVLDYRDQTKCEAALGYLPSYCARAVAEQAILMMLALWRKLKTQQQCFHFFCRDGLTGLECQDKKMLVVGVGNIGSEIVDIARGLHMKVAGVDIDRKLPSLEYTDLTSGLSWADVVVCALSLTQETKEMLSYETLRRVKTGTIFINIARGEISPLKDLKRLLDEQILGAVGLDVYDD